MTAKARTGGDKSFGVDLTPEDGGPSMPSDLRPEVQVKWKSLLARIQSHILRKVDETQLRILCELMVQVESLAEQVAKDPTDRSAQRLYLATADKINKLGACFGLSPGDRMRMRIEEPEGPDLLELYNRGEI